MNLLNDRLLTEVLCFMFFSLAAFRERVRVAIIDFCDQCWLRGEEAGGQFPRNVK